MIKYVAEAVFAVHILSKQLSKPTQNDAARLKRLARYVLGFKDTALVFPVILGVLQQQRLSRRRLRQDKRGLRNHQARSVYPPC